MTTAETVCVTGAGGYIASWLVKLLLSHHYTVHGTVRDPEDAKYNHLKQLDKAPERLKLFKADLLDYNSLHTAIKGCSGLFHVASPVPPGAVSSNPEVEMVEPAVKGTIHVLKACSAANVKRTVVVSSGAAVFWNPDWPEDQIKDETCWSDKEFCKKTNKWYPFSKTAAESEALKYAKKHGLDVVTLCPTIVFGPMLQRATNASSLVLINLLKGSTWHIEGGSSIYLIKCASVRCWAVDPKHMTCSGWGGKLVEMINKAPEMSFAYVKVMEKSDMVWMQMLEGYVEINNRPRMIVDVRDVVIALLLIYEKPEAEGRYICSAHPAGFRDLVEIVRTKYPSDKYHKSFKEVEAKGNFILSSKKLQLLGWTYRPLEETIFDSVENYKAAGLVD